MINGKVFLLGRLKRMAGMNGDLAVSWLPNRSATLDERLVDNMIIVFSKKDSGGVHRKYLEEVHGRTEARDRVSAYGVGKAQRVRGRGITYETRK